VIIERGAFNEGQHRWNTQLLALAETYGFTPSARGNICAVGLGVR
jgi:hypothetical protein